MDEINRYAEVNVMQHDAVNETPATATPPTPPSTRPITPYVAVWGALAVIALAYISVAVAWPDILGGTGPTPRSTAENNHSTGSQPSEELTLEQKLARMEQDLQTSLAENSQNAAEKKSHLDRIAALEAKAAKAEAEAKAETNATVATSEPAVAPEAPQRSSKQAADEIADRLAGAKILNTDDGAKNTTTLEKQAAKAEKTDSEKKVAAVADDVGDKKEPTPAALTKAAVKTADKTDAAKPVAKKEPTKVAAVPKPKAAPKAPTKKTAEIKTGSVGKAATKPITFGPAVVTRATRPIGVRIATGPSVDSLRLSWNALADRHGASLKRLQPRYVTGIDATGFTYDLIAGPFNTANEASEVCARLHANGARCSLGEFTGNAL